jgi:hypothetical protein
MPTTFTIAIDWDRNDNIRTQGTSHRLQPMALGAPILSLPLR